MTTVYLEKRMVENKAVELLKGPMPRVAGLTALIVGMGDSGVAAANLLLKEGSRVWIYDADSKKEQALREAWEPRGVRVLCGDLQPVLGIDFCVVSPGVPPFGPLFTWLQQTQIPLLGEMELASRFLRRPILAVTGTNGKTTVTHMIDHILHTCGYNSLMAGNVGYPIAQLASEGERVSRDPVTLEVSSFQCETFEEFKADVAVITNLAPDHLERYNSLQHYYETKFLIAINQTADEALWMGPRVEGDCPEWVRSKRRSFDIHVLGPEGIFYVDGTVILRDGSREERRPCPSFDVSPSQHVLNGLAAAGAACSFGVPMPEALHALESFQPLPHRLEFVTEMNGVKCYNDSKATNVHALEAALRSLPGPIRLIAGGRAKGDPLEPMIPLLQEKVRAVYLIGEAAQEFAAAWQKAIEVHLDGHLVAAVEHALRNCQPGEILLLSPACASWDQFTNYKERGNLFKKTVMEFKG